MKNPAVTKEDVYEIKNQEKISVEPNHDAEMRKSHTNDTEFSDTTTSKTNGGSSKLSKWIHKIKLEFNIPITTNHSIALFQLLY
ncbi:TPA: hypothetical protein O6M00_002827 [Staphylococcus aureus]|nr:hypothetical protein [Staphylococcus aureus]